MENKAPETIPYIVHESHVARLERTIKRLWILCIIIFLALVGTNAYWIWYESHFEDEVITQEMMQDIDTGEGDATVNGTVTGIDYGTSEAGNQANGETESP